MKDAIINATGAILRQLDALEEMGVQRSRLDRIRRETLFFLYEGGEPAKWHPERPHSRAARQLLRTGTKAEYRKAVTYEHAVPLASLREEMKKVSADADDLRSFLDRHILGVVLLRTEDIQLSQFRLRTAMPLGSKPDDRLARYRAVGIEFEPEDLRKLADGWQLEP